jgi:hypothetical protein
MPQKTRNGYTSAGKKVAEGKKVAGLFAYR